MRSSLAAALTLGAAQLETGEGLLSSQEIELGREELLYAVQNVKPDYQVNWHHEQLAEVLEQVQRGGITRLIVLMPPRHGKSELVSRHFPAWCLGKNPDEKIIACSYAASLAGDMGMDVQNIMSTDEYRAMFAARLKSGVEARKGSRKVKETNLKFDLVNGSGYYIGAGVGGPITGRGFSLGIIDDYCKSRAEAESKTWRNKVWRWYTSTFYTRREGAMSSGGVDRIIICATPWHEDDLIGRVLERAKQTGEVWHIVRFPAMADGEDAGMYESAANDPREVGAALWPDKFGEADLEKLRLLSPGDWSSLWQCRPAAAKGNIFKRDSWKRYEKLPSCHLTYTFSLDCAFKDGADSSFVVLQLWASDGVNHYGVDQWRARRSYGETKALCRAKFGEWKQAHTKLIEDKANGPAIISELKSEFAGIVPVTPRGSKTARAMAVQGLVEGGNVYLPMHADWVEPFIDEHASFPFGANDDQVDAMTQYLERSSVSTMDFLKKMTAGMR